MLLHHPDVHLVLQTVLLFPHWYYFLTSTPETSTPLVVIMSKSAKVLIMMADYGHDPTGEIEEHLWIP